MFRNIPRTVAGLLTALREAKAKYDEVIALGGTPAFSAATYAILAVFFPNFNTQVTEMDEAKGAQLGASLIEDEKMVKARMLISHYIHVLFFAIERAVYPNLVKGYFGMDGNQTALPNLGKETDIFTWGENIKNGEITLVANGHPAMANPSAANVASAVSEFRTWHGTQSAAVEAFDKEQEDVKVLVNDARELVIDIWDEVEFTYRKEDFPSKRASSRLYGVIYSSIAKTTISGVVTNASTGAVLEGVNVAIVETGEAVLTIADGTYSMKTDYFGAGTLEFSLTGFVTQTFPIDVPDSGTITQDVALVAV